MNKKFLILFFVLIFGIFIVSSAYHNNKIDKEVYDDLENNNKVRVIIKLKEPLETKGFIFKIQKSLSEINLEKEKNKKEIIEKVGEENVKVEFEDLLSTYISKEKLSDLETDNRVEYVIKDKPVKAFLQESVPLVNASKVWSVKIANQNITGQNEGVCVIDTGIDKYHADFQGRVVAEYCYCSTTEGAIADCCPDGTGEDNNATDNNGHGTHVAGIVGASGGINGVAINVSIVAIKALNSSGDGISSDIKSAIDWCVNNATIFNISVISMSLGGELSADYCNSDFLASSINSAVGKNISVIVATGNAGNTTQISSPACVENATAVGWSNGDDTINSQGNRNNITDLVAPGSLINSTVPIGSCTYCSNSGYKILSGTSMATPHVAGAFVLIRQFFKLQNNRVPTPYEIEDALNSTGKQIYDSSSGLNYSRIDIYSAIISLDNTPPNTTLITPLDNSLSPNTNQTFTCNATEELELSNMTFYLWNSSSDLINQTTTNISGIANLTSFNVTNLSYGNYEWNCLAHDSNNNFAYASSNFSLTIGNFSVSLLTPANNTFTTKNQTFNCSSSSTNELTNATFYLWNFSGSVIYNLTANISGTDNLTSFSYNFTNETNYYWNCNAVNNISESFFADSNFTITYDVTSPNITLINPSDSAPYTSNSQEITFDYNVTDNLNIANCSLIVNDAVDLTNATITNLSQTQSFVQTFTPATYSWKINCSDKSGNIENSSQRSFTITSPPVVVASSSGGSGGGGSSSKLYTITSKQSSQGYTKELKKNDKIKFTSFDETSKKHTLSVNFVKEDFVNITIQSDPVTIILGIGQSIKLNLTSDKYYDLYVKLENITNKKAVITIQTINEEIPKPKPIKISENAVENITEDDEEVEEKQEQINILDIIKNIGITKDVLIIILITAVLFILIRKRKYGNLKLKNKNETVNTKPKRK